MPFDYSRIHRLLAILTQLQSGSRWTAATLAGEFDVTERTIYRDLKVLRDAGGAAYRSLTPEMLKSTCATSWLTPGKQV